MHYLFSFAGERDSGRLVVRLNQQFDGKYEVLARIRVGGMGAIYKVRHQLLDEIRVVKAIRRPGAGSQAADRFLHEARAAIKLHHPNIAILHDFSLGSDGQAFIVMEYIEGWNLQEILRGYGPPPVPLTLEIARQSLKAIGYLHRNKLVHRDISPDNLMLTRDADGNPLVKLIDLGIAKDLEELPRHLTATGVFLGKPRYGSPERFNGGVWDERSDLYSFGVVLYELLTGYGPIIGSETAALMAGHLFLPPREFSETDPAGRVPEQLRAVVLKALAKRPEERQATAEDFLWELTMLQDKIPPLTPGLMESFWQAFRPDLATGLEDYDSESSGGSSAVKTPLMIPAGMVSALTRRRARSTPFTPAVETLHAPPAPQPPPPSLETRFTGRPAVTPAEPVHRAVLLEESGISWASRPLRTPSELEEAPVRPVVPVAPPEPARRHPGLWVLAGVALLGLFALGFSRMWPPVSADPAGPAPEVQTLPTTVSPAASASAHQVIDVEPSPVPVPHEEKRPAPPPKPVPLKPMQPGDMILGSYPGVEVPELNFLPSYAYPADARGSGRRVTLHAAVLVDEEGRVIDARISDPDSSGLGFNEVALASARGARYFPATRDGIAGKMWTELLLEFSE